MRIDAGNLGHKELNDTVRNSADREIIIDNCCGTRYIAAGMDGKKITINGVAGNALGCYLDGCEIYVNGNTQEATGDTMNKGAIYVNGNCGDATGYGMRGGRIYIKGNSGYRSGIHMKSYKDKIPVVIIGGSAGSFLGEYQAGGIIVVLGVNTQSDSIVGNYCGTGMHGGKMFLRCALEDLPHNLPKQVVARVADENDISEIIPYLKEYCEAFDENIDYILSENFVILTPDTKNPYKQLYTYS